MHEYNLNMYFTTENNVISIHYDVQFDSFKNLIGLGIYTL